MSSTFKILVVDDDLKNIQVGINILKQNENYRLVFATSGEQALERVKETAFDLVLLDILMPTMDGYQVCRQLKSDAETKHIPVIFLTAKHGSESLMKGFELGGADYITKPFNAMELHARVKTHLDLHYHYQQEIAKLKQMLVCSQKAESIKFIAGGIAHDCRNLLGSITGNLFLIEQRLQEANLQTDQCSQWLQGAKTATESSLDLLNQFFNFSCKDETVQEIVDLNEVVSDLKKVYKGHLKHGIAFETYILCHPALILADKLHVEQVLLNILINAQHAICEHPKKKAEGGKIRLIVDEAEESDLDNLEDATTYICIRIEDNGIGMTSETMGRIFELYFTTRENRGGTGLGLSISKHILQSHNGKISVASEPVKGTCFKIYLPAHAGT